LRPRRVSLLHYRKISMGDDRERRIRDRARGTWEREGRRNEHRRVAERETGDVSHSGNKPSPPVQAELDAGKDERRRRSRKPRRRGE
jgi:hypothetical protein